MGTVQPVSDRVESNSGMAVISLDLTAVDLRSFQTTGNHPARGPSFNLLLKEATSWVYTLTL